LESYEIVAGSEPVLASQLDDGEWLSSGIGNDKSHRLQGSKGQRVFPPVCQFFDRKAPLEEISLLEISNRNSLCLSQGFYQGIVLSLSQRAIDEIIPAPSIPGSHENSVSINRFGCHNRRNRVIEKEVAASGDFLDLLA
jgi:hypothetical protein